MSIAFVFPDPDLDPFGSETLVGSGYGSVKNQDPRSSGYDKNLK